jgi:hypothetical protein
MRALSRVTTATRERGQTRDETSNRARAGLDGVLQEVTGLGTDCSAATPLTA